MTDSTNSTQLKDNVSRETLSRLRDYLALLEKWNARINLVSSKTLADGWQRHVVDSLQLLPLIENHKAVITDLGSGGGLPGIVLAIALPEATLHLVESDQRKCAFLHQCCTELSLTNVVIHATRIEKTDPWPSDIVTARALKSLNQLILYAKPFINEKGLLLCLKGKTAQDEIQQATEQWQFSVKEHQSTTDAEASILELTNIIPSN
jgi:16S rRNA (guanine527-N7)-methyltransferase